MDTLFGFEAQGLQQAQTIQRLSIKASASFQFLIPFSGFQVRQQIMDWRDIPIFIINRNRLSAMRSLIDWLLAAGINKIIILDNQSDYPPLLDYYAALPDKVKLMLMPENFGPYVFWQQGVHRALDTPYIVTDSDLVPASFCPNDLIPALLDAVNRFPDCGKAGPGLRIDNLPDGYREADTVRKWESQFWEKPLGQGHFAAPVDTTFALYPAKAEFTRDDRNIRLGYPYIVEHSPWYALESELSEEERYYRDHTSTIHSNWSVENKTENRVVDTPRVRQYEQRPTILHAGCGHEYIQGWTNADTKGRLLDVAIRPSEGGYGCLPLADSSMDGIYMGEAFCAVQDVQALMAEFWRVCRPGGALFLRLPHGSADRAHAGVGRLWFERSFHSFAQMAPRSENGIQADWQLDHVWLQVHADLAHVPQEEASARIQHQRNWVSDMLVRLRPMKPARTSLVGRAPEPKVSMITGRLFPIFST